MTNIYSSWNVSDTTALFAQIVILTLSIISISFFFILFSYLFIFLSILVFFLLKCWTVMLSHNSEYLHFTLVFRIWRLSGLLPYIQR